MRQRFRVIGFLLASFFASGTPLLADPRLAALREAADYSTARRGAALLVLKGDRILFEDYENGAHAGEPQKIYSGTKAFWCIAAMCAVEEGLLSLDERAAETIAEWRGDSRRSRITIRQLLNFTDGIDPANHIHSDEIRDRNSYALAAPVVAAPGEAFLYGGSHLQIFNEVLRRKLAPRGETPMGYLRKKVLHPLGLDGIEYKKDAIGNPLMASGFKLTARQWARLGEMVLRNGEYGGRQIVSPGLLSQCFRGSAACPAFGFGFWNNTQSTRAGARQFDIEDMLEKKWQRQDWHRCCISREAPADLVACIGSGYQRLFVIPSRDLVVVRQGYSTKFSDAEFLRILLQR